jgi:hypothetical protein
MTYVANGGDNTLSIIAPTSTEVLPPANETNKLANIDIAKFSLGDYEGAIKSNAMPEKAFNISRSGQIPRKKFPEHVCVPNLYEL